MHNQILVAVDAARHLSVEISVEGGGTHYLSMGRDVPTKGLLFSKSVWNGDVFHC